MAILSKFGAQTIKINIADNIQSGSAGVMGDFNSRTLKVSINAENGEVLEDPEIKAKLLCKTEGDELIFTEGEYVGEGIYQVDFPNEVFEQEQELECIIQLSKEDEILYSRIFKRRVERGLLGTEREGTSTIIDLLKIMDFADHYEEKLKEMEELGNKEEAEIIDRAKWLTKEFDNNAADTYLEYDNNAEKKTDAFNENAMRKMINFNANATEKTEIVNNIKEEVEGLKDATIEMKNIFDDEYLEFNNKYNKVEDVVEAEAERNKAEEVRQSEEKIRIENEEARNAGEQSREERFDSMVDKGISEEVLNRLDRRKPTNFLYGTSEEWSEPISLKGKEKIEIGRINLKDLPWYLDKEDDGKIFEKIGWGVDILIEGCDKTNLRFVMFVENGAQWTMGTTGGSFSFNNNKNKTLSGNLNVILKPNAKYASLKLKINQSVEGTIRFRRGCVWLKPYTDWERSQRDFVTIDEIGILRSDLEEESASNREEFSKINAVLEEESASNREEFSKINAVLNAHSKLLAEILTVARDTNKKVDDSNRNYKALLESDKDLIG